MNIKYDYDYIIIGSGFGGSVSALRLAEKGYRVMVIEKGKWYHADDFPKSNWNIVKWLWVPILRFFGFFKITFMRHVSILSGVGVGGGSLVYANTLPIPKKDFFEADTWGHLSDWQSELREFYEISLKMLGANLNPKLQVGDLALKQLASEIDKADEFEPTNVAVYFGEPDKVVPDPYFDGEGPERSGCNFCGGCMIGCRYNAKNTLDKNYLYLAQKKGVTIQAESLVHDIKPVGNPDGSDGYEIKWRSSTNLFRKKGSFRAKGIILSGGVLGTVPLLLELSKKSLPLLSDKVGTGIRTNSESLSGITTFEKTTVFSDGIAIGSILHTDPYSHIEPVRYPAGSGAWRVLLAPMAYGKNIVIRLGKFIFDLIAHPIQNFKVYFIDDWAKRTQILLFMRTINTTLRFKRGLFGLKSTIEAGEIPPTFIPEAEQLAKKYAKIVNGKPTTLLTETLFGMPLTAHILGGCVMGQNKDEGVVDRNNQVFGYTNMYVCDGSAISANPGVNPALTIMALTERAMSKLPDKE